MRALRCVWVCCATCDLLGLQQLALPCLQQLALPCWPLLSPTQR